MRRGSRSSQARYWPETSLVVLGFVFNLAWEFLQSPLYADWDDLLWTVLTPLYVKTAAQEASLSCWRVRKSLMTR